MNTFKSNYVGPHGPHLSCLTKFSREGEVNMSGSMHPGRSIYGKSYNPRKRRDNGPITEPRNPNKN